MAEVVQLTLAGKKALEDKLEYLKNVLYILSIGCKVCGLIIKEDL